MAQAPLTKVETQICKTEKRLRQLETELLETSVNPTIQAQAMTLHLNLSYLIMQSKKIQRLIYDKFDLV